jgi:ribosomal protein L13E
LEKFGDEHGELSNVATNFGISLDLRKEELLKQSIEKLEKSIEHLKYEDINISEVIRYIKTHTIYFGLNDFEKYITITLEKLEQADIKARTVLVTTYETKEQMDLAREESFQILSLSGRANLKKINELENLIIEIKSSNFKTEFPKELLKKYENMYSQMKEKRDEKNQKKGFLKGIFSR